MNNKQPFKKRFQVLPLSFSLSFSIKNIRDIRDAIKLYVYVQCTRCTINMYQKYKLNNIALVTDVSDVCSVQCALWTVDTNNVESCFKTCVASYYTT